MKSEDLIRRHEGSRLKAYQCSSGKTTIGVGRNLDDVGISKGEEEFLFQNDMRRVRGELSTVPVYATLSEPRQAVLENMNFNLGLPRLLAFKKMFLALEARDYDAAASEMLDSKWATQVGNRANELSTMMRTGEWIS